MVSDSQPQYTVLARRFRPQSFADVVGQEHVGQAIRNAIASGRVAHAYLFTGARGVGKTSTARIFAKALNCPHVKDAIPCNQCEICHSIGEGKDVDVLEIDGASNRGIDDIRQLRANVNVRSMRSPYKVYIIDEVHMLTKEAFNALLKTLEEPPPNVKFVFCTTEPNKVPDTILSRCQRFDFGTIAQSSIATRLKQIAEAEGRNVDDDAIELIARRAAGSMRDSQSLFDQLLAFGGEQISSQDVHQLLGTASDDRLISLVNALIDRDQSSVMAALDEALMQGVQLGSFSDQLLEYFRDLLVTAAGAITVSLSSVSENSRPALAEQAERWGLQTITAAMQILAETKGKMQRVNYGRALVELALVRISLLEDLTRVAQLVQALASGQPLPATPRAGASPGVGSSSSVQRAPVVQPAARSAENRQSDSTDSTEQLKKNGTPERIADAPSSKVGNPGVEQPTLPVQQFELNAASLPGFWSQLLNGVSNKLNAQLVNSNQQAISGPNLLEIVFPKSYPFSKSYCERPEVLKPLRDLASQLAGKPLEVRIRLDESSAAVSRPQSSQPKVPTSERRNTSVLDKDDLVQEAVAIFGGQVVEVRSVFVPVVTPEDETDEA